MYDEVIKTQKQSFRCSSKLVFLKIAQMLQENMSLFNNIADRNTCNFVNKRLQDRCFHVKFAKFKNHFWRLHLNSAPAALSGLYV